MAQPEGRDDLAICLTRMASDPDHAAALSQVLGEFCHRACNELNTMRLALFLAQRSARAQCHSTWRELERRYHEVARLVQDLQLVCRPMTLAPIRFSLGSFVRERLALWTRTMGEQGKRLELIEPVHPAEGWFDPTRMAQGLDALVAWRAVRADPGTTARLRWQVEDQQFLLAWEEPAGQLRTVVGEDSPPASLALPILAKVIAAHRGKVAVASSTGWRVGMRWPCEIAST